MIRRPPLALVAGSIVLVLAACAPVSDQPTAEQELCDSLTAFGDSVQAIADVDPTTDSVEDIQAAGETAQTAWDQVLADAEDVAEADETALDAAWTDLYQEIVGFDTDVPIADAVDSISASVDDVQSVYQEMRDGLSCE